MSEPLADDVGPTGRAVIARRAGNAQGRRDRRLTSDRSSMLGDRVRMLALCCNRAFPSEISSVILGLQKEMLLEEAVGEVEYAVREIKQSRHVTIVRRDRSQAVFTYMRCFHDNHRLCKIWLSYCDLQLSRIPTDNYGKPAHNAWLELIVKGAESHANNFALYMRTMEMLSKNFNEFRFELVTKPRPWAPKFWRIFFDVGGGEMILRDVVRFNTVPSQSLARCLRFRFDTLSVIRNALVANASNLDLDQDWLPRFDLAIQQAEWDRMQVEHELDANRAED